MWQRKGMRNAGVARAAWERLAALLCVASLAGCTQEMANQPRLEPLERSPRAGELVPPRTPMPGTIARGQYHVDEQFTTGRVGGGFTETLPPGVFDYVAEEELLTRGRERFDVFCSHCHGYVGGGREGDPSLRGQVGMVVRRGFPVPPTFHQPRLREAPLGHFFEVISHGIGRMPAHGYLVPPEDRWAIAAYIKVLQLSQYAQRGLLSPEDLRELSRITTAND